MKPVRTTYVEFLYAGLFFADSSCKKSKTRVAAKVKVPRTAHGFRFFDIITATAVVNGKRVKLSSGRVNQSPMYYVGAEVLTLAQIRKKFPKNKQLLETIRKHPTKKAVRCRTGEWQFFQKSDRFVEAT